MPALVKKNSGAKKQNEPISQHFQKCGIDTPIRFDFLSQW
jgi:hypothetical protein